MPNEACARTKQLAAGSARWTGIDWGTGGESDRGGGKGAGTSTLIT